MGNFNRGSNGAGRRRDLARMPDESAGEGTTGNVIPRGTTNASVRRGQALLRILNDQLPDELDFNRGTRAGGRRRNFALMSLLTDATTGTGVQLYLTSQTVNGPGVSLVWSGENYDYGDWWTSGQTLTVPADGTYTIEYSFDVSQSSPSSVNVRIIKNGLPIDSQTFTAGVTPISYSTSIAFVAGDTIVIGTNTMTSTTLSNGLLTIT